MKTNTKTQESLIHGRERSIFKVALLALWRWGRFNPKRIVFLLRIVWRLFKASSRRNKNKNLIDGRIPSVLALSPTMTCNYNCEGCYSRERSLDNELTTDEIDKLFTEAEELGIGFVVVTGGEPLLRDDLLDQMEKHHQLLFALISNGTLISQDVAERIARGSNIVPFISIEGFIDDTDSRREFGAYDTAVSALKYLQKAGACYGFSAMTTAVNVNNLGSEKFVDQMVTLGCVVGVYIEYVPCGSTPRQEWMLDEESRVSLYRKILLLQRNRPIVLSQFPYDEYGTENWCKGAGQVSLHINSQGGVEPCPFMSFSCDNIRQGGLKAACQSTFLRSIREQPDLLRRQQYACSLFEHYDEVCQLHSDITSLMAKKGD